MCIAVFRLKSLNEVFYQQDTTLTKRSMVQCTAHGPATVQTESSRDPMVYDPARSGPYGSADRTLTIRFGPRWTVVDFVRKILCYYELPII